VLDAAEKVHKEVGSVSILINNAGFMAVKSLLDHTETDVRRTFDVNIIAHFWTIQAFLPRMIERNEGHIVGISSLSGIFGVHNMSCYSSSKFAVRGLHESISEELRRKSHGHSKVKHEIN
jgi:all-trans-retinol dehydrogenase (NAD+)